MGLLDDVVSGAEHLADDAAQFVDKVVSDLFGGGSSGSGSGGGATTSGASLTDIRWEGMSNDQLAHVVSQLAQGPGAAAMTQAADALANIAQSLQQIDSTLQTQLQAIGVNWQSTAGNLADEMTTTSAAYGGSATDTGTQAGSSVGDQGEAYSAIKNAVPNTSTLNGPTQTSPLDTVYHVITGHADDNAQKVQATQAARNQTIDALNGYGNSSQTALNGYHPLPAPPALGLTTSGVSPSPVTTTTVSGFPGTGSQTAPVGTGTGTFTGVGGINPTGGFGGGSGGSAGSAGGGGGTGGFAGVGGGSAGSGGSGGFGGGGSGGITGTGVPTGGLPFGSPLPGTGSTPVVGGGGAESAAGVAAGAGGGLIEDASVGAAIVGGSVAAGVAGSHGRGGSAEGEGAVAGAESEGGAASALAELDAEDAAAASAAARLGAVPEAGPTMMQPAVTGQRGEDDAEHHSKYAVDSGDMFGDDRMVTPPVLGDSAPEPPRPPRPAAYGPIDPETGPIQLPGINPNPNPHPTTDQD